MTKRELDERFLFFKPEIVFDGTIGGIKLAKYNDMTMSELFKKYEG